MGIDKGGIFVKVNYHMHTMRCHHAWGKDEDYVKRAIQAGFEEIGFSDHSCWLHDEGCDMRMRVSELDDYIASIQALKEKYKNQIRIHIGLECEYFEDYMPWLKQLLESKQIEYIILGNHFDNNPRGVYFGRKTDEKWKLDAYVKQGIQAMETGLYSYFAHPDLIPFEGDDSYYEKKMTELCLKAKETQTPLEFNLLGYVDHRHYPYSPFWKIAAQVGCQAIIGVDAHEPSALLNEKAMQEARDFLENMGLCIVDQIRFLK